MTISKIGVLGAGTMGGGIAQVAAQAGFQVVICDIELSLVEKAVERMETFLNKSIERGKLTAELKDKALSCITKSADLADFADADLVIEAISEDLELKKKAFAQLDQVCKAEALLATNTSSMSVTAIASATKRPKQVAGMHFFNPPALMKLVEVIRGYDTTDETVNTIFEVAKKMGKTTVEVKKDFPGFIVTRVNMAQVIEAVRLVEEGVASPEDIDTAMKLGLNWPMGPFELQDFMGVDVTYFILEYLQDEFKDMRWNPPQSLKALIKSGRMGRKNKAGWFDY
jgi:3-hydroxybutyryl-CoA dehydrogenase